MKVHLFHTNDIHSQLENWMRLGARLREARDEAIEQGDAAFTFDIGDVLDRVRPETEATMGRVNASMMAALGYDAWVFGNNEGLTVPVSTWERLVEESEAHVLGTNLRQPNGTPFPMFHDTRILEANGIRIGIFGLTPDYNEPYQLLPVQVGPPFAAAREAVAKLRERECDAIVCLSHLGLKTDHQLAADVPGIDLILGGHTHQFMQQPDRVGNTLIFQPGKHALVYGHTTLVFDDTNRLSQIVCEPVPVDVHGAFDHLMLQAWHRYQREIDVRLSRLVTTLSHPLDIQLDRESAFANVLTDCLTHRYVCDLGIMMAGALNASLLSGEVSWRDVHAACPTPTRPVLLSLTGRQIMDIMVQGTKPETYLRQGLGYGFRGGAIGWLAVSGAEVTLARQDDRLQVTQITVSGTPLQAEQCYRVVTCEYLWLSPVFPGFRAATDVQVEVPLVREVLVEYMRSQPIQAKPRYRLV